MEPSPFPWSHYSWLPYRLVWALRPSFPATFVKVASYGLRPFFFVVVNVFNTDSYVTVQIGKFQAGNYGCQSCQLWITIRFPAWSLIVCCTSSIVTTFYKLATTAHKAASYGSWSVFRIDPILCVLLIPTLRPQSIVRKLPATVWKAASYGSCSAFRFDSFLRFY